MANENYPQENVLDDNYHDEINWDKVGGALGVGNYDFVVVKAEPTVTKETRKPMLKVQFEVIAAYEEANAEFVKRMVFENLMLTSEGGFRTKEFCEAAGVEPPTVITRETVEEWAHFIVGKKCGGAVRHRMYQNRVQAQISVYFPEGTPPQANAAPPQEEEKPAQRSKTNGTANGSARRTSAAEPPQGPTRSLRESVPQRGAKTNGSTRRR